MPFGGVFAPSIGLSLLKAELAARGIPARVLYFSIRFAELVGQHFYYRLAVDGAPPVETLAGEWVFSRALFGPRAEDDGYVEDILLRPPPWYAGRAAVPASPALAGRILRARAAAEGFLERCRQ
jgi:hypothetical protein